jgi:hypothetical protein
MTTTNTTTETTPHWTLTDQALGAVMMALQKSLLEQSDIVPVLKGFKFTDDGTGNLVVLNPPLVKMAHEDVEALEDSGCRTDTTEE